jgi:hypothetical protein
MFVSTAMFILYFKPDEVAQHDGSDPEEGDLLSDEDGNGKEKDRHNPYYEMGEANLEKELGDPSAGQSQPPPQQPWNLNQKQASLFREALDLACDKLFNEISIKVMLEPDDGTSRKSYTPLTEEELGSYNALVDSPAPQCSSHCRRKLRLMFSQLTFSRAGMMSSSSWGILPHLGALSPPAVPRRHPRQQGLWRPNFRWSAWHSRGALLQFLLPRLCHLRRLHLLWRPGECLRARHRPRRSESWLRRLLVV